MNKNTIFFVIVVFGICMIVESKNRNTKVKNFKKMIIIKKQDFNCKENAYQAGCPGEYPENCSKIWGEWRADMTTEEVDQMQQKVMNCENEFCFNRRGNWFCQDKRVPPTCYNTWDTATASFGTAATPVGCPQEKPENCKIDEPCFKEFCDKKAEIDEANYCCRWPESCFPFVPEPFPEPFPEPQPFCEEFDYQCQRNFCFENPDSRFCPKMFYCSCYKEGFPEWQDQACIHAFCKRVETDKFDDPWVMDQKKRCMDYFNSSSPGMMIKNKAISKIRSKIMKKNKLI